MYKLKILEIRPKNQFALFERSDGEFGWLEVLVGEVAVGDILNEIKDREFLKCGAVECTVDRHKIKVYINDFGFEEDMRKEIYLYDKRI